MRVVSVEPAGTNLRIGVTVSTFNAAITDDLLEGALSELKSLEVDEVTVLAVSGALELPVAALRLIESGCHAVIAIGAVIKGETDHYELVAQTSTRALTEVSVNTGTPVANAVLAVREYEHAIERSRPGPGNKGTEAAFAAVDLARKLAALQSR